MSAAVLVLCMLLIKDPKDQEKFQLLYNSYNKDMLRAAYSVIRDYGLAEDAVQESLMRIVKVISSVNMSYNPRAFVITVAKNVARDMVAKLDREVCCFDTYSIFYEYSDKEMHMKIENEDLAMKAAKYVATLKPKYTELFSLRCCCKMQYKDIEKVLNVPEATLMKRMQRLRELIVEYLGEGE